MVNNRCKYLLLVFAWLQPLFLLAAGEGVSCDTMFVFKKMPADTVVVKKTPEKSMAKKKAATKKKAAVKKAAKKPKVDSVKFAPVRYSLGDRVIMHGDSGADVKKLAEIMIKHLYMEESAVIYTKDGTVLYDGELVRAVKLFQKVSGLYEDGMVGETTIKALRKIHRWRRTSK